MVNSKEKIKQKASELGFLSCGVSTAGFLEKEAPRLEKYLNNNQHGKMGYLANHFDKRLDPTLLVPGAKSVISLLFNYYPHETQNEDAPQISKYAYGTDYHFVIKDKLKDFFAYLKDEFGDIDGRVFVDSAPVLDKAWAAKSGLGWIGKHTNLISKKQGSFFFIAEMIIDLELEPDGPVTDHCGSCTKCIDACPTDAIIAPYEVDGSKCISYFTIELRDDVLPSEMKGKFENWMFGCDICQDVCPWNRFSTPHQEPLFNPHPKLIEYSSQDWEEITEEIFREIFKKSAVKRTKFSGLTRNLKFLAEDE